MVGLKIEVPGCKDQIIVRAGRQNNSGTYVYFRSAILKKQKRYDLGILDMLSSDVVHLVERTPCAIGYIGLAYATTEVKMACVQKAEGEPCILPSISSASDKSYAIARPLFVNAKNQSRGELKSYLDWILSDTGQCIIKKVRQLFSGKGEVHTMFGSLSELALFVYWLRIGRVLKASDDLLKERDMFLDHTTMYFATVAWET